MAWLAKITIPVLLLASCSVEQPVQSERGKVAGAIQSTASPAPTNSPNSSGLTYYADTQEIFTASCDPCHASTVANANSYGFFSDQYDPLNSVPGVFHVASTIRSKVADDSMPVAGSGYSLTSVQKNEMLEWIDAGAPKGIQPTASPSGSPTTSPSPTNPPPPLTIAFAEPSGASVTVDASATIKITVSGAASGATWSLYRGNSAGATSGGTLLDTNLQTTGAGLTYTWITSGLSLGVYHLYATVTSGTNSTTAALSTPITINHPGVPNFNLAFTAPLGTTEFNAGSVNNITYTANPPSGTTLTYRIDFKQVGGTYAILAQNLSATTYGWNIADAILPALYKLQLRATDQNSFVNTIESDVFRINGKSGGVTWIAYNGIQKLSCDGSMCHGQGTVRTKYVDEESTVRANKSSNISKLNDGSMPKAPATITPGNKTIMLNYLNGLTP